MDAGGHELVELAVAAQSDAPVLLREDQIHLLGVAGLLFQSLGLLITGHGVLVVLIVVLIGVVGTGGGGGHLDDAEAVLAAVRAADLTGIVGVAGDADGLHDLGALLDVHGHADLGQLALDQHEQVGVRVGGGGDGELKAVGITGVGQKLLGLFGVVLILALQLVAPLVDGGEVGQRGGPDAGDDDLALLAVVALLDGVHVDGHLQRLADADVAEGLLIALQGDGGGRRGVIGVLGVVRGVHRAAELRQLGGVQNGGGGTDPVQRTGHELGQGVGGVIDVDQLDAVQIGELVLGVALVVVIVVLVLHELHAAADGDVLQDVGAGAAGILPGLGAVIPLGAGDVDHGGHEGVQSDLGGGAEVEHDGVVIGGFHALHHVQLIGPVHFALNGGVPAAAQAEQAVIGVLDVGGDALTAVEGLLVLEEHVLTQVDGQSGEVVGDVPGVGDLTGHVLVGPVGAVVGVVTGPVHGPQTFQPEGVAVAGGHCGVIVVVELVVVHIQRAAVDGLAVVLGGGAAGRSALTARGGGGGGCIIAAAGGEGGAHGQREQQRGQTGDVFLHCKGPPF